MEAERNYPEPRLGLHTLYEGQRPTVDIIAVHGLGASHAWKCEIPAPTEASRKYINWLSHPDMLPLKIPNSRIMSFSYESAWLFNAPKQTRMNCGIQLHNAVEDERCAPSQTTELQERPIIFIGHSFGGVVIEQAMMIATQQKSSNADAFDLSMLTAGIVFLGTPHRGSKASSWAAMLAAGAGMLQFKTEPRILQDLEEFSETMKDLIYEFGQWIHRNQVPAWCFFEQHATDLGIRAFPWFKGALTKLVVSEESASIDGLRKQGLPSDHMKLAKFTGPNDACFRAVFPKIQRIAKDAIPMTKLRRHPRIYITDNRKIPYGDRDCLSSLFHGLDQPIDHMQKLLRNKGDRTKHTCEWVPRKEEYVRWLHSETISLLRLTGPPGVGKTMIATHLINELMRHTELSSRTLFAFFFCDSMPDVPEKAAIVVRILIAQLLQQNPSLFEYIRPEYDIHKDGLRTKFDALWRILVHMISAPSSPPTIFLIDALDECDSESQNTLSSEIARLYRASPGSRAKFLVLSRPELDIERSLGFVGDRITINSNEILADLTEFISETVQGLKVSQDLSQSTHESIKTRLLEDNDGTFLWVSFVAQDLARAQTEREMLAMLSRMPKRLSDIYDRILLKIDENHQEEAVQVLRVIMATTEPWNTLELAMLCRLLEQETTELPNPDDLRAYRTCYRSCGSLLNVTTAEKQAWITHPSRWAKKITSTFSYVGMVHSSMRNYLGSDYLRGHTRYPQLRRYYCDVDQCRIEVFRACCKLSNFLRPHKENSTSMEDFFSSQLDFLGEVPLKQYQYFNLLASIRVQDDTSITILEILTCFQNPRHLIAAVEVASELWAGVLVRQPWIDINWEDHNGVRALRVASSTHGSASMVDLLLSHPDIDLGISVYGGPRSTFLNWTMSEPPLLKRVLEHPNFDATSIQRQKLLFGAVRECRKEALQMLIQRDVDLDACDANIHAALHLAISARCTECAKIIIQHPGIDVNFMSDSETTPLHEAVYTDNLKMVTVLLDHPAIDISIEDRRLWTPLQAAVERYSARLMIERSREDGHEDTDTGLDASECSAEMMETLLRHENDIGCHPSRRERDGSTEASGHVSEGDVLLP